MKKINKTPKIITFFLRFPFIQADSQKTKLELGKNKRSDGDFGGQRQEGREEGQGERWACLQRGGKDTAAFE